MTGYYARIRVNHKGTTVIYTSQSHRSRDEAHSGPGRIDEWKGQRHLGVGAEVVIIPCALGGTTK